MFLREGGIPEAQRVDSRQSAPVARRPQADKRGGKNDPTVATGFADAHRWNRTNTREPDERGEAGGGQPIKELLVGPQVGSAAGGKAAPDWSIASLQELDPGGGGDADDGSAAELQPENVASANRLKGSPTDFGEATFDGLGTVENMMEIRSLQNNQVMRHVFSPLSKEARMVELKFPR